MTHFKFYVKQDILSLVRLRRYETKIGERVQVLLHPDSWIDELKHNPAKYVLLGIPEDIGVKANFGMGGTDSAWLPFITSFLNTQSNDYLTGEQLLVLGHFDFGDIQYLIEKNAHDFEEQIDAYRHAVTTIDDEVEKIIKGIVEAGKIPIIIGGGHNNSYPIIKATAKALLKLGQLILPQINVINLDAHADYRPMEGRHSGNAFTYAEEDGYLQRYCVLGLHENYLPQNVFQEMIDNPFIDFITYEDLFIHKRKNFTQAIHYATGFTEDTFTGIELDMDCIEGALASAGTPCGISPLLARQYINNTATQAKVAYLHICEGAHQLSDGRKNEQVGKLISYFVSDFIKAHLHK